MRAPPWIAVCPNQRLTEKPSCEAEYMTAPERFADSQIPLAPRAPSIHDPCRKWSVHRSTGKNGDQCRRVRCQECNLIQYECAKLSTLAIGRTKEICEAIQAFQ